MSSSFFCVAAMSSSSASLRLLVGMSSAMALMLNASPVHDSLTACTNASAWPVMCAKHFLTLLGILVCGVALRMPRGLRLTSLEIC